MLLELDRVMQIFEEKQRENIELIRKIQVLEGLEMEKKSHNLSAEAEPEETPDPEPKEP